MLNAHSCVYFRPSDAKVYYFNVNWVLEFKFKKNKHKRLFLYYYVKWESSNNENFAQYLTHHI